MNDAELITVALASLVLLPVFFVRLLHWVMEMV